MTQLRSINKIFAEDNLPVELVKAPEGYLYYIFDLPSQNIFETYSVYTSRVNNYTKDWWVRLGREFAQDLIHERGIYL